MSQSRQLVMDWIFFKFHSLILEQCCNIYQWIKCIVKERDHVEKWIFLSLKSSFSKLDNWFISTLLCVCVCVYMYIYTHAHMIIFSDMCIHTYTNTNTHTYICIDIRIMVFHGCNFLTNLIFILHTYIYIYILAHTHTHTHMYTYIYICIYRLIDR